MENKKESQADPVDLPIRPAPQVKFDQDQAPQAEQDGASPIKEKGSSAQEPHDNEDGEEEEDLTVEVDLMLPEKRKKKKRSKKPKSKRGLVRNDLHGYSPFKITDIQTE
jgi:hypothetical protein